MPATDLTHLDLLRHMISLNGWKQVMKPLITQRIQVVKDLALALPAERPKPYSEMDDLPATYLLKGEAKALAWVANVFEQAVAVDDANRRRDELARQTNGEASPANPVS